MRSTAALPLTRLVYAFGAPMPYLGRPYIVYRSRDPKRLSARSPRPAPPRLGVTRP